MTFFFLFFLMMLSVLKLKVGAANGHQDKLGGCTHLGAEIYHE